MEAIEQLSLALGLATLAGINLYLTVFVTGLSIHLGWLTLGPATQNLEVLADPTIILLAGLFYALEFFADKVPWVDSFWDALHTFIRPVGGVLLALQAVGEMNPAAEVIVILLAGSASALTHTFKASTRLVINASPEPITNVAASVTEDVGVLALWVLMMANPLLAAALCLLLLAILLYTLPKLWRIIRSRLWLLRHRWKRPPKQWPVELSPDAGVALSMEYPQGLPPLAWAIPTISGRQPRGSAIPPHRLGYLVALGEPIEKIYFVPRRGKKTNAHLLPREESEAFHHSRFLSETLSLTSPKSTSRRPQLFHLPKCWQPRILEILSPWKK